ncbi:hypothetical protein TYRP_010806 [Tyrophagus putrescentiae]|nr:hypothetical protein TYRP_010806 [Tyrophagus putrescentiae]
MKRARSQQLTSAGLRRWELVRVALGVGRAGSVPGQPQQQTLSPLSVGELMACCAGEWRA